MTEITRLYQFIVYETDGTTPDLTFNDNAIVVPPVYGGWRVNPLEGTSVSEPFPVQILDTSEQVTSNLSDANGRADLIGRVWEIKINEDGGGLTTKAKGRIVGVDLGSDVVSYVFQCGDERFFTRGIELFTAITATTTQLWPAGLRAKWNGKPKAPLARLTVKQVNANEVLFFMNAHPAGPASDDTIEWVRGDLLAGAKPGSSGGASGNFNHMRINIDGTDREVLSFNISFGQQVLGPLQENNERATSWSSHVWVAWVSSGLSVNTRKEAYFHAPSAPASETLPFHIGGNNGVDLISWLKGQYDTHSIRYDSDAFSTWNATTKPEGLLANPLIPNGVLRVTGPERLSVIEEKLFKTYGLAPFPNASGEINPRFVTLPHDVDPTALTQITSAKLRLPHPTFSHGLEMVTVIQGVVPQYTHMTNFEISDERSWPADRIKTGMVELDEITHDRIADLGRHVHRLELFGVTSTAGGDRLVRQQATELFDRYGDGRIRGAYSGLSALDGDLPGDYVVLNLSSYPDLATQTRAGLRLVQILERRMSPFGGEFEYIDVGADDQPVAAPAIAIIQNTSRTKHDVDITISSLPGSHNYQCQIKIGSRNWENVKEGTSNETFTISNLPSNTAIQTRARSTKVGVVRSPWTDPAASVTTAALGVPSSLSASVSGTTITLTWTNGEADYAIMPTLGGADFLEVPLAAGSTRFVFTSLAVSTEYTVGVKHIDDYGGSGTIATQTPTTSTATTLTAPRAIVVLQGAPASGDTVHPEENRFGAGIEIRVHRLEPHADTEVQVDDNSGFTSPDSYVIGSVDSFRIPLPLDNTTRHIRARHTREGWTASAWTGTVTAKPIPFAEEAGVSDGFAGGLATLGFDIDWDVILTVSTADPDTDRAYFELNKTEYITPTTSSSEITRAQMPYSEDQDLIVAENEIAYLDLQFYSDLKGFGQGVRQRVGRSFSAGQNQLFITAAGWSLMGTIITFKIYYFFFNIALGSDTQSIKIEYDPGTGAVTYNYNTSGAERHALKQSDGSTVFAVLNNQASFTVTVTPYAETNATGDAGNPVEIETGPAQESGSGTAAEAQDGTIVSGNALKTIALFNIDDVDGEPRLILQSVHDFGAKSANFAVNAINGGSQKGSISASVTLTGISNLVGVEPFSIRVACGANTLTLSGGAFEGPRLTFTGNCAISFVDFGTGNIVAMGADY